MGDGAQSLGIGEDEYHAMHYKFDTDASLAVDATPSPKALATAVAGGGTQVPRKGANDLQCHYSRYTSI